MEVTITILPTGEVAVAVDNEQGLDFEEARARLARFLEAAGLSGAPLVLEGEIERHVHDHAHVHGHVQVH